MTITLVGAGNVARNLCVRWINRGGVVAQVFSRRPEKALAWSAAFPVRPAITGRYEDLFLNSDLYVIAVGDDAIAGVAESLARVLPATALVVHTSGSTPAAVLTPFFKRFGVLYPLQTFTADRTPDFEKIPVLIDAQTPEDFVVLEKAAALLSPLVYRITDEKRVVLHVAAVFVNNFTNFLLGAGERILQAEQLPADLLKPLIEETFAKARDLGAANAQTGPARRGDLKTIERQQAYIETHFPELADVYRALSQGIIHFHQ